VSQALQTCHLKNSFTIFKCKKLHSIADSSGFYCRILFCFPFQSAKKFYKVGSRVKNDSAKMLKVVQVKDWE
jgi:hypothetical protein